MSGQLVENKFSCWLNVEEVFSDLCTRNNNISPEDNPKVLTKGLLVDGNSKQVTLQSYSKPRHDDVILNQTEEAIVKLFYKQFTVSHDPHNTIASSNEEILQWFNKQLVYYGQARWQAKGLQWSSVQTRLDLSNIRWKKRQAAAVVNNKPSVPPSLLRRVKRRLFEPTTTPQSSSRKLFES